MSGWKRCRIRGSSIPTDGIVKITSSAICGSDLHLYEVLGPYMKPGDIPGHEPMGIVQELGAEVTNLAVGDRVVVPFNISCGHCFMCYPQVLRLTALGRIGINHRLPPGTEPYIEENPNSAAPLFCSRTWVVSHCDCRPTVPGRTVPVLVRHSAHRMVGSRRQFATRIGKHWNRRVIEVDVLPERRDMAARHGVDANCDPAYAGLVNQAYGMAKQRARYRIDPGKYNYHAGQTVTILWNVAESGCGGAQVSIANQATAGLYNYTPYQPNVASLAAYPGTGDACSTYGNRNFFYLFVKNFGPTGGANPTSTAAARCRPPARMSPSPTTPTSRRPWPAAPSQPPPRRSPPAWPPDSTRSACPTCGVAAPAPTTAAAEAKVSTTHAAAR